MAWTSPRTWLAGEKPTAAIMNTHIRDDLNYLYDAYAAQTFTAYTPTLGGCTGTVVAQYYKSGKLVTVAFEITMTAAASGTISITTPTTMPTLSQYYALGSALMFDTSVGGASRRSATVGWLTTTTAFFNVDSATTAAVANATVPWTWASGDTIGGTFTYREA